MPVVHLPAIKNILLAAVAALILTLAVNAGYGLARLVWRGAPLPEALRLARSSAPYLVLGLFLAAVGTILGARLVAGKNPRTRRGALAVGAGLTLTVVVVAWLQGRLDFWLPPNAFMAVVGAGLGAWLAR
jgi:FAD/FMN-containing dehydrogenase